MLLSLMGAATVLAPTQPLYYAAPSGQKYAIVIPGGQTVLPNGRFLTPHGKRLYTGEDLWQVAVGPNGKALGFCDNQFWLYQSGVLKAKASRAKTAPAGQFLPGGKEILVSLGDTGSVEIVDADTLASKATISANSADFKNSYITDLVVTPKGDLAYGLDVAHQRVVVFDLKARKMVYATSGGRQPYALALSPDGKKLYVANIGLFDYSLIPPSRSNPTGPKWLSKPPFGFPSKEAETGVEMEDRFVKGLGSAYVPDAQSVFLYDLKNPLKPNVMVKQKAGLMIHAPADGGKAQGGSAPNELLVRGDRLYVANANNDSVQILNARNLKPIRTIKLTPTPALARLRGVIPSGMAMNKTGTRLYVCESGLNSVAVLNPMTGKVIGRIPSGWFPMQIELSLDEKTLYVACQKGLGRGPRGVDHQRPGGDERFGLSDMPGMIQAVAIPTDSQLKGGHYEVLRNNGLIPRPVPASPKVFPRLPGKASPEIKHVVFITKENHTFDGIFGGLKGAKGYPKYAEFGMEGWLREKSLTEKLPIMPNHIKLAEQFAISDNFYMEPQASGDGHRWLVGVYPSLWTTRVFYSGWDYRPDPKAPGRFVSFGSYGSQFPEDYLENGSMWEHLERHGLSFRNYGEGYEMPRGYQNATTNRTGVHPVMNHPMPMALFKNTDFGFPAYNTYIPDIARYDWFVEDIEEEYRSKGKSLPRFMNIAICNDHGDSPRPKNGYPYTASYMADNDLALGKIVEYLSKTPEWKNMVIFVTQDDSGGDNDHVDRHRSFVMAIGPWVKKGYVSKDHTSIMSIIRSIYLLFGLGPNNMFDAVATDLGDMFTDKPDFTPYKHVMSDPRVFKPEDTFDPSDPKFEKRRVMPPPVRMDDPKFLDWLNKGGSGQYKPPVEKE